LDQVDDFRVVARASQPPNPPPQTWTRTDRGAGRLTFHVNKGGDDLYLTNVDHFHVITHPKQDGFDRQTWREDMGAQGHIQLGQTNRWLQADSTLAHFGLDHVHGGCDDVARFVVEVVPFDIRGQSSEWDQQ
jgi:hypothetical protein